MNTNICTNSEISFQAYTPIDSNRVSRRIESVASIFTRYCGQFEYENTRQYPSCDGIDCCVPIDEFEAFINAGHMSEELCSFVAEARAAGAGFVVVFWNYDSESQQ